VHREGDSTFRQINSNYMKLTALSRKADHRYYAHGTPEIFAALEKVMKITRYIFEDGTDPGDVEIMRDVEKIEKWLAATKRGSERRRLST